MTHSPFSLVRLKTRRILSKQLGRNVAVGKNVKCLPGNPKQFKYFSGKLPPNDDIEWIYSICR